MARIFNEKTETFWAVCNYTYREKQILKVLFTCLTTNCKCKMKRKLIVSMKDSVIIIWKSKRLEI